MYMPLLVFVLVVVAVYAVAGVWRYLRQESQSPRDDEDPRNQG